MTECRICREEGGVMISPCACDGSIGKVHDDCLQEWTRESEKNTCEICNTIYAYRIEYFGLIPESFLGLADSLYSLLLWSTTPLIGLGCTSVIIYKVVIKAWSYFVLSPLTLTNAVAIHIGTIGSYMLFGGSIVLINGLELQYRDRTIIFNCAKLLKPAVICFRVAECIFAIHHVSFTGWTPVVKIMYYMTIYNLFSTLYENLSEKYKNKFIRKVYINTS